MITTERGIQVEKKQRLSARELHGDVEVERALSYFIDPQNLFLQVAEFASVQAEKLAGRNKEVVDSLMPLAERLEAARRFDRTYLGHMLSQPCIPALYATWLATMIDSNTVAPEVAKVEVQIEKEASEYILKDIIGYEETENCKPSGTFTSGGTMANLTALAVARKVMPRIYPHLFREKKNSRGVVVERFMGRRMRVLVAPQCHYSIPKAVDLLGGPSHQVELVYVGTKGLKMSVDDLEKQISKAKREKVPIMAIVALAGETETGLVDPLNEIAEIAKRENIFSVADGAYGAAYKLSRNGGLFEGLNRFDAVVWDPHKTAYTPYGIGFVGFKDARDHIEIGRKVNAVYVGMKSDLDKERETEQLLKEFLSSGGGRALGRKRVEGSMGAAGPLSMVAIRDSLGTKGLGVILDITLDNIDYLYNELKVSSYLCPFPDDQYPDLNLLCFGLRPEIQAQLGLCRANKEEENDALMAFIDKARTELDNGIRNPGGYFFSSTSLKLDGWNPEKPETNLPVWRACLMHPLTSPAIIDQAITGLEQYIKDALEIRRQS